MAPDRSHAAKLLTGALVALSAACAGLPPGAGPPMGGVRPKASKTALPARAPSRAAGTEAASTAPIAPLASPQAPAGKLTRPARGTFALAGQVRVDAVYAASQGGTLLSDHGNGLVANNGGAIVALGAKLDGGRLVSNNGGAVIAERAGNIVAPGEAGFAADLGGGLLLANNGSSLIANDGGAVVSNQGGSLVSKTKLRLLEATGPVSGTQAAAAGMLVSVVSLRDRRYLPLGVDAAGKPVYAVYSNAEGAYEVYVPEAEQGNLLVVVGPPGEPDRRLAYNLVTAAASPGEAQVDELSALASRYLRGCFTGRLADLVMMPDFAKEMLASEPTTTAEAKRVFREAFDLLAGAAARAGIDGSTDAAVVRAKAQRIVDTGLADMDLEAIMIDAALVADWKSPPKPAMAAMRARLDQLMAGTARRLADDPAFFSTAFLEGTINAPYQPGWTQVPLQGSYTILKPADFGEFLLIEYFGNLRVGAVTSVQRAFRLALGSAAPRDPDRDPALEARVVEANTEFRGAVGAVMIALCRRIGDDPSLVTRAEEIFRAPIAP